MAWNGLVLALPSFPLLSPGASASYPSAGAVESVETDAGLISEMQCEELFLLNVLLS